jgi:quercetin dioxygenase-like cupin family protein
MEIGDPKKRSGSIEGSKPYRLEELVSYQDGTIVSRTLSKGSGGTLTVFAFDAGQELSEHSAPFDAYVTVLDGEVVLIIGGYPVKAVNGETVLMPADVPHAVKAETRFKMLLTMLRHTAAAS